MKQADTIFESHECVKLQRESLALWVTTAIGPRIIGLSIDDGDNLLAILPDTVETPGGATYSLHGGHRLWHAPEHPDRTYVPDDEPPTVTAVADGITFTQPVESLTGIEKQITVTLPEGKSDIVIDHTLVNRGIWPITLAPWAITQLKPGGFAILPQPLTATGLLPNRRLALWPYTDINSHHIQWGNRFVFIHATMQHDRLKVGWANRDGWLAYWIDDTLFVKSASYRPQATYGDFGSSSECYCDPRFIELETVGPKTTLSPDEKIAHREMWKVFPNVSLTADEADVSEWIERLRMGV